MAFVHLGTSSNNNKKVEVNDTENKNTTLVEKTKEESLSNPKTNVQSKPVNSAASQQSVGETEKAAPTELQDHVKNVDETDHVHSPSHNKENLAEQNPITNEQQMSFDSTSSSVSVVNNPTTTQQASNTIQIVESDSLPASNTNADKPKLIQPKVVRNDKPDQSKTDQGSGSSKQPPQASPPQSKPPPPQPKQAGKTEKPSTQKKADLDAGGNFCFKSLFCEQRNFQHAHDATFLDFLNAHRRRSSSMSLACLRCPFFEFMHVHLFLMPFHTL